MGSEIENHETLLSRITLTAVQYSKITREKTFDQIYEVIVWSLTWLAISELPPVDRKGRQFDATYHPERTKRAARKLEGGYQDVFSEMRG